MELKAPTESDIDVFLDNEKCANDFNTNLYDKCVIKSETDGVQNKVPKRRRCDSDESDNDDEDAEEEEFVEKRILKRRKFKDEIVPKLFQSADPEKRRLFFDWVDFGNTEEEIKLCGFTIPDPMTFFREVYLSRMWLDTDHVDIAMLLLRERQVKHPTSFGSFNRAILDSNFHELLKLGTADALEGYVEGSVFEHGKKWNGCTHLYYPVCTRKHWIAVEVVVQESALLVYDCDHRVISTSELEEDLRLASVLIPKLAKIAEISMEETLKIVRVDGLPRQPFAGDCGIYTIKYIEFLSIEEPVDEVEDQFVKMWRRKLAFDFFNQNCDP